MSTSGTRSVRLKVQPVVVHRQNRGRPFRWLYLLPAALLSLLFNVGLLGAMYLFGSPTRHVETEKGQAKAAPIKAEQAPPPPPEPENQNADPYLAPSADIDPSATDVDVDLAFNNKKEADVNVPGLEKPGEVGIEGGTPDVNPFNIAPPQGLGGVGQGGAFESIASGQISSIGALGGYSLEGGALGNTFGGRSGAAKEQALREGGGTEASEAAVNLGLHFLHRMQQPDGRWRLDAGTFVITDRDKSQRTVTIPDRGHHANDVAGTALGLLPFLAAGKTHKEGKDNPFDKPIEKALAFLLRRQDKKSGNFGGTLYSHGLATIAVCEAYGLTKDPILKRPAQDAINYIVFAQHSAGGWRYGPGQPGDTSVVGWQVMALKSGQLAGLEVPQATMDKAIRFLDSTCNPSNEGYGYIGQHSTNTMSAVGLLCRQYLQFWGPNNPRMIKGVERNIKTVPPTAQKNIYYYYYATQVMHHFGGDSWKAWNTRMRDHLVETQVRSGDLAGSWDSRGDGHGSAGGRLMQTSLSLLTLEVYYRHLPLFRQN